MNETIFDRITLIVDKLCDGKNTVLASKTGVNEANIRNYKNGVMPKADFLEKVVRNFDINSNWLLTGEGNMLKSEKTELPVAHRTESNEGIPLIPINAMAGAFTGDQTVMEYECDRYIIPSFKGADFLIGVKGSSMYPRYNSGDIVACKRLNLQDLFFQWNKVYVLDTDQGPLIKRIKPGTDKDYVTIVSDNKDYEPFELAIDHIYHVALVVGVIRVE